MGKLADVASRRSKSKISGIDRFLKFELQKYKRLGIGGLRSSINVLKAERPQNYLKVFGVR